VTETTRHGRRISPNSASEWAAALPRWLGMAGLVACFLFWAGTYLATGHGAVEPLFVTAFGGLLAVGQGADALTELRRDPLPPIPPADPPRDPEVSG
jgi:hypothetical protein